MSLSSPFSMGVSKIIIFTIMEVLFLIIFLIETCANFLNADLFFLVISAIQMVCILNAVIEIIVLKKFFTFVSVTLYFTPWLVSIYRLIFD
jgi:hypothetical protein